MSFLWQRGALARRARPAAVLLAVLLIVAPSLTGCASRQSPWGPPQSPRLIEPGRTIPVGGGKVHVGDPYVMHGRLFIPQHEPTYDVVGTGAWMGHEFHGRRTANGEIHDSTALVAAHPTLPLPAYVKVTSLETGRSLVLRLNDRGPFNDHRIIDVSNLAARLLGFERSGLARLRVQYLRPAPLNGDPSYERHYLALQPWARCRPTAYPAPIDCYPVAARYDGGYAGY